MSRLPWDQFQEFINPKFSLDNVYIFQYPFTALYQVRTVFIDCNNNAQVFYCHTN